MVHLLLALVAALLLASPAVGSRPELEGVVRVPLTRRGAGFVHVGSDGIVDLAALRSLLGRVGGKYAAGAANYHANTGKTLPGRTTPSRFTKRQREKLRDEGNEQLWAGKVLMGNPPQACFVDFDTGSGDFWIPADDIANGFNTYRPSQSSTAQEVQGASFSIKYGDGSIASGPIYTDTVSVAGFAAQGQAFSAVNNESLKLGTGANNGILGLSYPSLSSIRDTPPFFINLFVQGIISSPVFAFNLQPEGSILYLGGTDPNKFTGPISFTPVIRQAYWEVQGSSYIDGQLVNDAQSMIIDTGTTLLLAPLAAAQTFYNHVPGAVALGRTGFWAVPCVVLNRLVVSLAFANTPQFSIPSAYLNLGQYSAGSAYCVSSLAGQSIGVDSWIVGDVFLRGVYSVYVSDLQSPPPAER